MPLLILLVLVVAEIYVLITVGGWIGAGYTILLLAAFTLLGAFLLKREGVKAFRSLREAVNTRRPPHREVADGVIIFLGGLLMLLPGFISDVVGLLCLIPPTRALIRRGLFGVVLSRVPPPLRFRSAKGPAGGRREPPVIEGEIDPR
ncbi:MAG: FxsA family protein [Geodermatophilaceae bacterium]|nr:FxsA family protein [Geodermatophilaceae bacterium]MDQ3466222.1 FxsA family protein [Actinomycetota bacterium]